MQEKLVADIDAHAQAVRAEKLQQLASSFKKQVEDSIAEPAASLLDAASPDTWPSIRKLLDHENQVASAGLAKAMAGFEPSREEEATAVTGLSNYARSIVEKKAREEAAQALIRMKDRFNNVFGRDHDSLPRVWSEEHDVRAITKDARVAALKLLAVIAALRLCSKAPHDGVEAALMTLVKESEATAEDSSESASGRDSQAGSNALASSTWPGITSADTIFTPGQCRSLWRQFKAETEYTISQALSAQEASKHSKSWLPPPWAIAAIIVLGFNEFMTLLRNPIYLPVLFIAFLMGRALYVQLDFSREFQYGALPGIMSISTKLLPTMMGTFKGLVDAGREKGPEASSATVSQRRDQLKLA